MSRRFWLYSALVFGLVAFHLVWWHSIESRPPAWDESTHLHLALDWRGWIFSGVPISSPWVAVYPPLYHLLLIPFLSFGTPSAAATVPLHLLFFALLIASFVIFADLMNRPREDAALAALAVAAGTHVLWTMHRPLIDFPLMCWVSFGVAILLKTDGFTDRRWSLAWGLVSGLGLLLKPFYPMWLLAPCLVCLFAPRGRPWGSRLANFAMALGLAFLVCLPYYGWQGPLFLQNAFGLGVERGAEKGDPGLRSAAAWLYYLNGLVMQASPWGLAFALMGWVWLAVRRAWRSEVTLWLLWLVSGYLFFSLVPNKDYRYTLALLPPLALGGVFGWTTLRGRAVRPLLAVFLAALFLYNAHSSDPAIHQDWKNAEIGDWIASHHDPTQPLTLGSVLSNHPYLFGRGLRWVMRARGQSFWTTGAGDPLADFTEFVVTKSGDVGPDAQGLERDWQRLKGSGRAFENVFPAVARYPLPDGSTATVYQRDPDHIYKVGAVSSGRLARALRQALGRTIQGPLHVEVDGNAKDFRRGRVNSVHIWGGPWRVRGIPVAAADVRLEQVWVNLYQLFDRGQPGLIACARLLPQATVKAEDLLALVRTRAKDLQDPEIRMENGSLRVRGRFRNIPVEAKATVGLQSRRDRLVANIRWLKVRGIPIPGWLFGKVHIQEVPLDPIPSFPVALAIGQVTLEGGRLQISPSSR